MGNRAKLLRLMVQADQEAVVTAVLVTATPTKFTSQLQLGQDRKRLKVYNASNGSSGECCFGFSDDISTTYKSYPIPKGEDKIIEVAEAVDVYFVSATGETGDFRVQELA
jgi:hypothetical protein